MADQPTALPFPAAGCPTCRLYGSSPCPACGWVRNPAPVTAEPAPSEPDITTLPLTTAELRDVRWCAEHWGGPEGTLEYEAAFKLREAEVRENRRRDGVYHGGQSPAPGGEVGDDIAHALDVLHSRGAVNAAAAVSRLAAEVERLTAELAQLNLVADEGRRMFEQGHVTIRRVEAERDALRAARRAYASEFPPGADGEPDVGSVHQNIRALKAKLADVEKDRQRLRGDVREAHDMRAELEMLRARVERITAEPLATVTTAVHPDTGDGPWVEVGRVSVPRAKGSRVVVTIRGDAPGMGGATKETP